jgi:hypothetical protein
LKAGGRAIPPMTRHVFSCFLLSLYRGNCAARQYLPG